ncbi:TatD family hydrolase [Flavobacterium ginsenosidimutans]|uniref:TatD family hydrolase n=1 Tax=Flavobacterium ginsenosidimutans TaxID=687844 RepID=A0ABZ2QAK3_9FLAO
MSDFLFDTHSHLDLLKSFDYTVQEIEKKRIYTIAVTNLPVLYQKLITKVDSKYIKPALGFHPELIDQYQKYIPEMWKLLPDARYIGEVGLDFKIGKDSKVLQTTFFEELISRCNDIGGKILTIHSRGSAKEVISIIGNNFNGKYILHWYSGNLKDLHIGISNGAYFSINYAMVTSSSGQKIIESIPNERLLLESDSPFILINKKPFSTLEIDKVVTKLAAIKNISFEAMLHILYNNFKILLNNA